MENNTFLEIKKSLGSDFPPKFVDDSSAYRNCYAHALNLWFETPESHNGGIYTPGCITALSQGSDIMLEYSESNEIELFKLLTEKFTSYEIDLFIKQIQRDCDKLGLFAHLSNLEVPSKENSYKIIFCVHNNLQSGWHFIRESISKDGKRIWTHKFGFLPSARQTDLNFVSKNSILLPNNQKYDIKAILEISKK